MNHEMGEPVMNCALDTWTLTCIRCERPLNDDGDTMWVDAEPAVNWPGDPMCLYCYDPSRTVLDRKEDV